MREIKFRAKRIDMDRWIYGQYFITPLTDENSGTTPDAGWCFLSGEKRHCIVQDSVCFIIDLNTLGQYTGLKDKNGKEIYENDIFKAPHDFGPGGFDERQAVVRWHELQGYQWNYWLLDQLEVVGNIYENPELMQS